MAAALVVWSTGAWAQAPAPVQVQLSGDGERLGWLESGALMTTPGPAQAAAGVSSFRWGPDGALLFTREVRDAGVHAFIAPPDGGAAVDLTPWPWARAQLLAVGTRRALVAATRVGRAASDVYRVELPSLAVSLDTRNPGDVTRWLVDPSLAVRGAVSSTDAGTEVRVRDGPRGAFRRFIAASAHETVIPVGFTEDGSGLFVVTTVSGDTERVVTRSLRTGEERVVARVEGSDVLDVLGHPTRHRLRAVAFEVAGRATWTSVDYTVTPDLEALDAALEGDFTVVSADGADARWIVAELSDVRALRYWQWERAARTLTPLFTHPQGALAPPVVPVSISAADGVVLRGQLLRAPGALTGLALILPPWQPRWGLVEPFVRLAGRGLAVLQVGVRGTTGRGKRFRLGRGLSGGTPRTERDDLDDALSWARAEGLVVDSGPLIVVTGGERSAPAWASCVVRVSDPRLLSPPRPAAAVGQVGLVRAPREPEGGVERLDLARACPR